MEGWEKIQKKRYVDKKTGREVIAEPPDKHFKWRDGYVLRSIRPEEGKGGIAEGGAVIGGQGFEWVPKEQVEIDK